MFCLHTHCDGNPIYSHDMTNLWTEESGHPSKVLVDRNNVVRTDLRLSTTVEGDYKLDMDDWLRTYFHPVIVGVGKKYVYPAGGFMAPHVDAIKEPLRTSSGEEIPHIGTIVVTRDSQLHFPDQPIVLSAPERNCWYHIYCFSLNVRHEVKAVEKQRVSFVFPLYGRYDPVRQLLNRQFVAYQPKILFVREKFAAFCRDYIEGKTTTSDSVQQIYGIAKGLDDPDISYLFDTLVNVIGDEYELDHIWHTLIEIKPAMRVVTRAGQISYTTKKITDLADISSVEPLRLANSIIVNIRDHLDRLADSFEQRRQEMSEMKFDPSKYRLGDVPQKPFILCLQGYYGEKPDLISSDKLVFDLLKENHTVTIVPCLDKIPQQTFVYNLDQTNRVIFTPGPSDSVSRIEPEFNDQGQYYPDTWRNGAGLFVQ